MDDQLAWQHAVTAADEAYRRLPADNRARLDALIDRIMQLKEALVAGTVSAGSAAICCACGGQCCLSGKYHFSVLDLLAYRRENRAPVVPDFGAHPHCPYGSACGCLMPPRFRPMTCVVFNCETVIERLEREEQEELQAAERQLRETIRQAEAATAIRLGRALLLSVE